MPFNGAGAYTPPGTDFPAVASTLIESTKFNNVINDIASALSSCITKDGQTTVTANLPMSNFRHTGVSNGAARDQYAAVGQVQDSAPQWAGNAGGTADVLTLTLTPAITAYTAGQRFVFLATATNTGAATLNVNAAGAKAIQKNSAALVAGDITNGKLYEVIYDGTQFQLSSLQQAATLTGTETLTNKTLTTPAITGGTITQVPISQNSQSANYTTVLADGGKHILHPTADNNPRTFTIDSNANVAYPTGTCITFVNQINTLTIAITADTLTLAGAGSTGSRTLAANGIATAMKVAATSWIISGTGLS